MNDSDKIVDKNKLYDLDVEADVLSALLLNNQNIDKVVDILKPHHFYNSTHQKIYQSISNLINKGQVADVTNISYGLKIENFDLKTYLNELLMRSIDIIPVKDRAEIVSDLYVKRAIVSLAGSIKDDINNMESVKFLESIENRVFELRQDFQGTSSALQKIGDGMLEVVKTADIVRHGEGKVGISTGFEAVDGIINGLHSSDLLILAARPSMGKTALALNMAYNIASTMQHSENPGGVAFFSLEMSSDQIVTRALSMISGVNFVAIKTGRYPANDQEHGSGKLTDEDFGKLTEVSKSLSSLPLFIDDTPAISTSMLKTKARMLKQVYGISAIFIDYLQLMRSSSSSGDYNRVNEISEISQSLKAIAKELDIPVIALSQLSRQVEARDDKRPQLSDLRESGAIEQDADVVMFLFREEYYLEKSEPRQPTNPGDINSKEVKEYQAWKDKMYGKPAQASNGGFITDMNGEVVLFGGAKNVAEVIIAKHRNGPTGTARLFFDKSRTAFFDLANS